MVDSADRGGMRDAAGGGGGGGRLVSIADLKRRLQPLSDGQYGVSVSATIHRYSFVAMTIIVCSRSLVRLLRYEHRCIAEVRENIKMPVAIVNITSQSKSVF